MLITQTEVLDMSVMRIGVLTSGGDTPGMNAAIRAVSCLAYITVTRD